MYIYIYIYIYIYGPVQPQAAALAHLDRVRQEQQRADQQLPGAEPGVALVGRG